MNEITKEKKSKKSLLKLAVILKLYRWIVSRGAVIGKCKYDCIQVLFERLLVSECSGKICFSKVISARCILTPVLLDDEELADEDLEFVDEEMMSLIKFNVSFPLIDAVLRDESFSYALRLNTMRLVASVLKGKFIEVYTIFKKSQIRFRCICFD